MDIIKTYTEFCAEKNIPFQLDNSLAPYDTTTLFCPAGMQQFKSQFKDPTIANQTKANIQSCLRLVDMNNIDDGTHFLFFNMMGLFSFRGMTVPQAIDFWMEFLDRLNLKPDYITIHPDKPEWAAYYTHHQVEARQDKECIWSDGELSGYCTEFYKNGIEIGNIVNINGDCIDVGFGLERLDMVVNNVPSLTDQQVLTLTIHKLIDCGYVPSNKEQGYVLRRLIRTLYKKGGSMDNQHFQQEVERQEKIMKKYLRLKDRYSDKPKEWWFDTHGIDLDMVKE